MLAHTDIFVGIITNFLQMDADTNIETFVNIYNFSKSAWEPLVEPWQLSFHVMNH